LVVRGRRRAVRARIGALEAAIEALGAQVCTRRVAVVDRDGIERIVGEVVDGYAELRVELPASSSTGPASLLLFATPPHAELGDGTGLQIWADGEEILEICAWRDERLWRVEVVHSGAT
jgi:hypothetical protein